MNSIIEQMLSQHESAALSDKKNSIKEVVQEIMLCGLSRAGFFRSAAFYVRHRRSIHCASNIDIAIRHKFYAVRSR